MGRGETRTTVSVERTVALRPVGDKAPTVTRCRRSHGGPRASAATFHTHARQAAMSEATGTPFPASTRTRSTGRAGADEKPRLWEVRAALRAMNRVGDNGGRVIAHDI